MNGADRLCDVLLANGVDVCFANPGTSEMHFVAALDRRPDMRCVLALFEGVATGAADGYGRMTGRPAAVLLHTGPGLANGLANLHNARRARSPVLVITGDHATYHLQYDPPLASDIESLARPMSGWVGRATGPDAVANIAADAYRAALTAPGVATMILPADAAWGDTDGPVPSVVAFQRPLVGDDRIRVVAEAIRKHHGRVGVLVGGEAARGDALAAAGRITTACAGVLLCEVLPPRVARGAGRPDAKKPPYFIDPSLAAFKDIDLLVLCGAPEPVAFFAYPGKPSRLLREGAEVLLLTTSEEDQDQALGGLADLLRATNAAPTALPPPSEQPGGRLTGEAISLLVAQMLPEGAILVSEGLTSAPRLYEYTAGSAPHDHLMIAGGSIGYGIPCATGSAIACPDRKVISVQADGSGMYTLQGLWTQARERLDVVTLILSNRRYAILEIEMRALGYNDIGRNASRMMSLDDPGLDWVHLAKGMGVEAARATTAEGCRDLLRSALARRGPILIECVI